MIKYFISVLMVIILTIPTYSQIMNNKGGQVLLKGVIRDDVTGSPVSVNIEFKGSTGSKIKVTSNSKDGFFEQILKAGESYDVILSNFDIIHKTDKVQIIDATQYQEQSKDFTVTRLTPGLQLYKISAFDKSSHAINDEVSKIFNDLQELMKFNRNVKFEVIIAGDYQAPKPQVAANSKNKKDKKNKNCTSTTSKKSKNDATTQQQTLEKNKPISDKVRSLVDSRTGEVQSLIESWQRSKDRISFKPDYEFLTPNSTSYNLIISVTSVEKTFN
jgi:hypothetical protein